jgi:hypothetical protein
MSTVQREGNDLHSGSPEVLEGERRTEHERWRSGFEPWSPEYERRISMEVVTSGSMIEATAGFAAIVLCILSLVNILPMYLVPIAALIIGIGLLFEGGAVAFRYWRLPAEISAGRWASMELAGGMIAEFVAGITGAVLGLLAILGFIPLLLSTVAVLVFGGALVLGSGLTSRLESLEYGIEIEGSNRTFYRSNLLGRFAAVGVQIVIGFVAIVLGILSLIGFVPWTLTAIALLVLGFSALLSGSAISNRIMHLLRRC